MGDDPLDKARRALARAFYAMPRFHTLYSDDIPSAQAWRRKYLDFTKPRHPVLSYQKDVISNIAILLKKTPEENLIDAEFMFYSC